jgi:uracil-DNA glycosylase
MGPRPIFAGSPTARLRLIGQAPGRRAHIAGMPFADASGDRLRAWMGVDKAVFYDAARIAVTPMGFCYPGNANGGDKLPDPICARTWHERLRLALPNVALTLLVGGLAQKAYLPDFSDVTKAVSAWRRNQNDMVPLPHPSWHNNRWLKLNPWFGDEMLPVLRQSIAAALAS